MITVACVEMKPFCMKQFSQEVLKAHNQYRFLHGVAPLTLSKELSAQSQEAAEDQLVYELVEVNKYPGTGQNIYLIDANNPHFVPKGYDCVNAWYHVNDENDPDIRNDANFTQIIWRKTRKLGVGVARAENRFVIVCQYLPPGNVEGEYKENIQPIQNGLDCTTYEGS